MRSALIVVFAVVLSTVAFAGVASAKPVCVTGSDCGSHGGGTLCTRYDSARGYWTDCVVDWGGCGIFYHRCIPPP